ncbi:MAG: GAF domain-containing protein [Flavobacterium sp.]|nr:GAF domain-containing protein [Flavobacterium sp.]
MTMKKLSLLCIELGSVSTKPNLAELEKMGYRITQLNTIESLFQVNGNADVLLVSISKVHQDSLELAQLTKLEQFPVLYLLDQDVTPEIVDLTMGINSIGYLSHQSSPTVLHAAIQNGLAQFDWQKKRVERTNKLEAINSIYELLLQISTLYLGKSETDDEIKINESLKLMGRYVQADRAYIFDYDWHNQTTSNTYEWCNDGISSEINNLQEVPCEYIHDWVNTHKSGKAFVCDNVQILDDEDELKKILAPQNIKSIITVPIFNNSDCIGFVGFDYVNLYSNITQKEYDVLSIYTQILNSLDTRKRYEKELLLLNEALELKVIDKTKEILQKDEIHTLELKQHVADLEDILFSISHRLRQPIVNILGLSQLIEGETNTEEELHEIVRYINQNTKLLDDFSREITLLTQERKNRNRPL